MRKALLILFSALSTCLLAQEYKPGKIINNFNDTLRVIVHKDFFKKNTNTFSYKLSEASDEVLSSSAVEIKEIQIANGSIKYRLIEVDSNLIYAKLLVEGKALLYKLNKKSDTLQYVMSLNNEVYKLGRGVREIENHRRFINNYQRTISYVLRACDELTSEEIARTRYSDVELKEVFITYNDCVAPSETAYVNQEKKKRDIQLSNDHWEVGLQLVFPGAERSERYGLGLGIDFYYLYGRINSLINVGVTTGFVNYFGKDNSFSYSGQWSAFDINSKTNSYQIVPLAVALQTHPIKGISIGLDVGKAFSFDSSMDTGLYLKPYLGVILFQQTQLNILYKSVAVENDQMEDLGFSLQFLF